jgi:hypothetical protein
MIMKFNCDTGIFNLSDNLTLSPKMSKKEILAQNVVWEEWFPKTDGVAFNYRTVIDLKGINGNEKIAVIINFNGTSLSDSSLKSWLRAPIHKFSGVQTKPESKITKNLRTWFKSKTSASLPANGSWGSIDAAYDPHNQTAEVVCHYNI